MVPKINSFDPSIESRISKLHQKAGIRIFNVAHEHQPSYHLRWPTLDILIHV